MCLQIAHCFRIARVPFERSPACTAAVMAALEKVMSIRPLGEMAVQMAVFALCSLSLSPISLPPVLLQSLERSQLSPGRCSVFHISPDSQHFSVFHPIGFPLAVGRGKKRLYIFSLCPSLSVHVCVLLCEIGGQMKRK